MTLSERIRSDIETRIKSGDWRPGHRIPFEHALVATYGCSRATVSKALEALAKAGLIERRRKAGSFVAHPHVQSAVLEVPDLPHLIAALGEVYRWQLNSVRELDAEPQSETGIAGPVLEIEGIHHGGGEQFALEHRLIALATVPGARDAAFTDVPPGTWLLAHVPWTEARHRIKAIDPTRAEAALLGLTARAACLQIERWTWQAGEAVTYVRQVFPGHRYDLVAEFKPGR